MREYFGDDDPLSEEEIVERHIDGLVHLEQVRERELTVLEVTFEDDNDEVTDDWVMDELAHQKEEAKDRFRQVWEQYGPETIDILDEILRKGVT